MLNLESDREKIDILLSSLPQIHTSEDAKMKPAVLNLGCAYQMTLELLDKSGGRVLTFSSRIENIGPCINVVTENHKSYNTDGEKAFYICSNEFYTNLASEFFKKRITVDFFS